MTDHSVLADGHFVKTVTILHVHRGWNESDFAGGDIRRMDGVEKFVGAEGAGEFEKVVGGGSPTAHAGAVLWFFGRGFGLGTFQAEWIVEHSNRMRNGDRECPGGGGQTGDAHSGRFKNVFAHILGESE